MNDKLLSNGLSTPTQMEKMERALHETVNVIKNKDYYYLRKSKNPIKIPPVKTIAVMTSGGDSPGMNATIRAVVLTAAANNIKVVGIRYGFMGLVYGDFIDLITQNVNDIIQCGGTKLHTAHCPNFTDDELLNRTIERLKAYGINALIVIGGGNFLNGVLAFANHGFPCIAIPATIENDIACTEYSIGHDTATNTVIEMIDRLRDTSESHDRCTVVQVMGRHAGHLALNAGVACGATSILIPEVEYDFQRDVIDRIKKTQLTGKMHFIIVVAECIGSVEKMAGKIESETGIESRATILGHIQRGGSPTAKDRVIASYMGNEAVHLLLQGQCNRVIVMQENHIMDFDIEKALECENAFDENRYWRAMEMSL